MDIKFLFVIFPFLRVSSFFDSLDWGLTPVRATASYSNEGLVAATISPCAEDQGRVSAICDLSQVGFEPWSVEDLSRLNYRQPVA